MPRCPQEWRVMELCRNIEQKWDGKRVSNKQRNPKYPVEVFIFIGGKDTDDLNHRRTEDVLPHFQVPVFKIYQVRICDNHLHSQNDFPLGSWNCTYWPVDQCNDWRPGERLDGRTENLREEQVLPALLHHWMQHSSTNGWSQPESLTGKWFFHFWWAHGRGTGFRIKNIWDDVRLSRELHVHLQTILRYQRVAWVTECPNDGKAWSTKQTSKWKKRNGFDGKFENAPNLDVRDS